MEYKEILINNINKIHTTELGHLRIFKATNLKENEDILWIKECIYDNNSLINKRGKNYYVINNNYEIYINSYNYSVITVKKLK